MSTETEFLNPGDTVYTYVKRGSETPMIREGIIQAVLEMPSIMPQAQFVLMVDGVLVIRDKYTCSKTVDTLQTYDLVGESHLFHD